MKKTSSYKLSIENPCQENWDGMEMSEIGKFCQLCQKNVVDFTMMSDREIIQYLENYQNQKICGRVAIYDLNRDLVQTELVPKNSWKFKMISCVVFLSTLFSSKLFAQKKNVKIESQHKKVEQSLQICDSTKKSFEKKTQSTQEIGKSENSTSVTMGIMLAKPKNVEPKKLVSKEKNVKPKSN